MTVQPTVHVLSSPAPPGWWPDTASTLTIFARPEWLATADRSAADDPHVWFRTGGAGGDGPIPAAMRGTEVAADTSRGSMNPYHWLFGQTAYREGVVCPDTGGLVTADLLPTLVFVYPGLEFSIVGRPGPAEVVELLNRAVSEAAQRRLRSVALGFVQAQDTVLREGAVRAGYFEFPMATLSTLEIAGRTANEVFARYSANQRASFRRTRRLLQRNGVRVHELVNPAEHLDTLATLRCAHLTHHGRIPDKDLERRHLHRILTTFGPQITLLVAERVGEIRAFALFLADGATLHSYMLGKRDPKVDLDIYFELNFYAAAEYAAARNFARISYGYGTEEAKRRRGCRQEPAYGYVRPLDDAVRNKLKQVMPG